MGLIERSEIVLEICADNNALPQSIQDWIRRAERSIQVFWDCYKGEKVLFTESDFWFVGQSLAGLRSRDDFKLRNNRFLEWGSGFGVIAGIAARIGWQACGVESETFLWQAAKSLHEKNQSEVALALGNFLPNGSEQLSEVEDPRVSLLYVDSKPFGDNSQTRECETDPDLYPLEGFHLGDVGLVYAYSWPGEEHFLKQVFAHFAAPQTHLLLYRGPFQLELYTKN